MTSNNPRQNQKSSKLSASVLDKNLSHWFIGLAIVVATCAAFLPSLWNDFVEWDDYENLISNPYFRGLGWSQLGWMFTTFHMGPYQPLSWLTLGLDYVVWGMNPVGYHLTSLLLHSANAVSLYFVSRQLLMLFAEKSWQVNLSAAFVAICFALHPLRVESVAWATERRDVLSGLFYLWTSYFYLRAHSKPGGALQPRQWMFAAWASYLLSLLSKATAITFPAVMVLIDIYPLRRLKWNPRQWLVPAARNVWREKIPFFALAVLFALLAIIGQERSSAVRSFARYGTAPRLAQALFGSSFYLWKTLMPTGLSPLYEIPPNIELLQPAFFATSVTTIVLSVVFYRLRYRWPAGLVCWAYYLAVLAPVLGLLPTGPQLVADRYSYLSCLSWAVLAGGGLLYCLRRFETSRSLLNAVTIGLSVAGLSTAMASLTWRQTTYWRNTETLWNRVLQVDPNSSLAHYNLARYIAKKGRYDEAIFHYKQALAIRPDDADSLNNLGLLFGINGDLELAIEYFKAAIRIDPDYAKAYFNLGKVLVRQGRLNEAIASFQRALQLQPGIVEIHENLGRALAMQGKKSEAAEHFETALRLLQSSKQAQLSP